MQDLERKVGELARRGLSVPEIAERLHMPASEVRRVLDPQPGDDRDATSEASFPASDPPARD